MEGRGVRSLVRPGPDGCRGVSAAGQNGEVVIRPLTPGDDLEMFGRILLTSYRALSGHVPEPDYEAELVDIRTRVATNTVFGALADTRPLGCVTFVPDASDPHAERLEPDEASFRMLGVAPEAQGSGIGEQLVHRCLRESRDTGKAAVFIYSGHWMTGAHRLYERLGFTRRADRDWPLVDPPVTLLGFRYDLRGLR